MILYTFTRSLSRIIMWDAGLYVNIEIYVIWVHKGYSAGASIFPNQFLIEDRNALTGSGSFGLIKCAVRSYSNAFLVSYGLVAAAVEMMAAAAFGGAWVALD